MSWRSKGSVWAAGLLTACAAVAGAANGKPADDRLAAARRFVEQSDRYLHHSRLKRGMEGYGLTVLAGTEIVRFKAKVVSVVTRWGPHQDVILAMLSEHNLEHTGIIAGMSGSPVYFRDERDGKDKLVGAVAYGWRSQKDPLCGIQPITQMLAAGEFYKKMAKAKPAEKPAEKPAGKPAEKPAGKPAGKAAAPAASHAVPGIAAGAPYGQTVDAYLRTIMGPRKIDFAQALMPAARKALDARPAAGPELVPLATPLMVSGARPWTLRALARSLEPVGFVPVASGGVNAAEAAAAKNAKLVPGAAIAVTLGGGDADYTAVGTVTDVVDGHLLAFGHSFNAEGDIKLPIGPAYVHTCVAGLSSSFKLSSALQVTGTLQRDEAVAVGGAIGPKPPMIPMTVTCRWPEDHRTERFQYTIANHRFFTSMMVRYMLSDAALAWHEPPERHTVQYSATVSYGKLGTYKVSNISSGDAVYGLMSDVSRPVSALLATPYGDRVAPSRIDVDLTVRKGDISASMLDLKLAGEIYRPGETVTGVLTIRPYRADRKTLKVEFKLPDDLPEGGYTLTVCDASYDMSALQSEKPHLFSPRTTKQVLEAVQRVVELPAKQLYLRLPVRDGGGLALAQRELPDLPDSRARLLAEARILDTNSFRQSIVQTLKTDYIISGSRTASFRVQKEPGETLLRK